MSGKRWVSSLPGRLRPGRLAELGCGVLAWNVSGFAQSPKAPLTSPMHDGFRVITRKMDNRVKPLSPLGNDLSQRFAVRCHAGT